MIYAPNSSYTSNVLFIFVIMPLPYPCIRPLPPAPHPLIRMLLQISPLLGMVKVKILVVVQPHIVALGMVEVVVADGDARTTQGVVMKNFPNPSSPSNAGIHLGTSAWSISTSHCDRTVFWPHLLRQLITRHCLLLKLLCPPCSKLSINFVFFQVILLHYALAMSLL